MKSFIKNNKFTIIAIAIFLVIVLLLVQVKNIFFPSGEKAIYGDRLKGIEEVEISKTEQNEVVKALKDDASIKNASLRISGKTVEIVITANDDVDVNTAKGFANKSIEQFSEEQKKFYDFQVFIKKDTEESNFPIIGYKHHNKDNFTFTKDRAVS